MTGCGSFPLMNLAQDFGVDYGDVLLAADWFRRNHAMEPLTLERDAQASEAWGRIHSQIGCRRNACRYRDLVRALSAHAARRWGRA